MTAVLTPPETTSFEADLRCQSCLTTFHVDHNDLQVARFQAPATYWFGGSPDATTTQKLYVTCPAAHCTNVITIDDSRLGAELASALKAHAHA